MTRHKVFNKATGRWVYKTGALGRKIQAKDKKKPVKKPLPTLQQLFKKVGKRGVRLSAAAYYKLCGSSLKTCSPQWISTSNGGVLKKIALVNDAWGGKCAKWVKA